jgi:hypothetical protein
MLIRLTLLIHGERTPMVSGPVGGQVIDPQPEQPLPPLAFPVLSLSQFKQPTVVVFMVPCVQSASIVIVVVASF